MPLFSVLLIMAIELHRADSLKSDIFFITKPTVFLTSVYLTPYLRYEMSTLDILTWPERTHRFRMEGEGKSRGQMANLGSPGKWPVNYAFYNGKGKGVCELMCGGTYLDTCYSTTWFRLLISCAVQSWKWQLIGSSRWSCGALYGSPLPVPMDSRCSLQTHHLRNQPP